jgi:hypothetical protein
MSAIRKTGKVMLSELHVLSLPKSAVAFMLLAALSLSQGLFGRNASTEAQAQQQQMQYFTSDGKVITVKRLQPTNCCKSLYRSCRAIATKKP